MGPVSRRRFRVEVVAQEQVVLQLKPYLFVGQVQVLVFGL